MLSITVTVTPETEKRNKPSLITELDYGVSMATLFLVSNPIAHTFTFPSLRAPPFRNSPAILHVGRRRPRGSTLATRAGPSTSSYVFAIALPLSLLAVTVFTALRIGDKLDQDFYEEVNATPKRKYRSLNSELKPFGVVNNRSFSVVWVFVLFVESLKLCAVPFTCLMKFPICVLCTCTHSHTPAVWPLVV